MRQHQEQSLLKSGRIGLGDRLRQSMNNLVVDVWGLERKTANSLHQYFEKVSTDRKLPKEFFTIRISCGDFLLIGLYHKDRIQFTMTVSELFQLLNAPVITSNDLEKLIYKVKEFFKSRAEAYKAADLYLGIQVIDHKVWVQLISQEVVLETLPFHKLINELSIW